MVCTKVKIKALVLKLFLDQVKQCGQATTVLCVFKMIQSEHLRTFKYLYSCYEL